MNLEELLALMSNAVVKTGMVPATKVYGRPERLRIVEDTVFKGTCKDVPCKVYNVRGATGSDGFLSYICDYKAAEINYQVLDREADFCFTTTMNGCTFGVGSPTTEGTVLVSHTNMATPNTRDPITTREPAGDQPARQLTVANILHGPGASYLTPDMYRSDKANVTLFGARTKSGEWKFYYQRWAMAGTMNITLLNFQELTTTKGAF